MPVLPHPISLYAQSIKDLQEQEDRRFLALLDETIQKLNNEGRESGGRPEGGTTGKRRAGGRAARTARR